MEYKFYCYICKNRIYGKREIKKHILQHFINKKCPYCNMEVKNFVQHFTFYHLYYRKKAIFRRDLAILCKEIGSTKILYDKNLKLSKTDRIVIQELLGKL
jgi:hypothetical protein